MGANQGCVQIDFTDKETLCVYNDSSISQAMEILNLKRQIKKKNDK